MAIEGIKVTRDDIEKLNKEGGIFSTQADIGTDNSVEVNPIYFGDGGEMYIDEKGRIVEKQEDGSEVYMGWTDIEKIQKNSNNESKPEPKPEPESKPEPKPESKPEPKPESKPEPKPETKETTPKQEQTKSTVSSKNEIQKEITFDKNGNVVRIDEPGKVTILIPEEEAKKKNNTVNKVATNNQIPVYDNTKGLNTPVNEAAKREAASKVATNNQIPVYDNTKGLNTPVNDAARREVANNTNKIASINNNQIPVYDNTKGLNTPVNEAAKREAASKVATNNQIPVYDNTKGLNTPVNEAARREVANNKNEVASNDKTSVYNKNTGKTIYLDKDGKPVITIRDDSDGDNTILDIKNLKKFKENDYSNIQDTKAAMAKRNMDLDKKYSSAQQTSESPSIQEEPKVGPNNDVISEIKMDNGGDIASIKDSTPTNSSTLDNAIPTSQPIQTPENANVGDIAPIKDEVNIDQVTPNNASATIADGLDIAMRTAYAEGAYYSEDAARKIADVIINRAISSGTSVGTEVAKQGQFVAYKHGVNGNGNWGWNDYGNGPQPGSIGTERVQQIFMEELNKATSGQPLAYDYKFFNATGDNKTNTYW